MPVTNKSSPASGMAQNLDQMAFGGPQSRALMHAAEAWFTTVGECQREMISFVSMRLEKDGEIFREMTGCKNMADVTSVQTRWFEETLRDYNSEVTKLMALYAQAIDGGMRARP